ncbi:50S ribosomal protein L24 [Candidatus Woesearchaeota archaeon]|nr:50S ribosomal protein L24 [Candidatus Woesearchaeota archaeon]
MTQLKFSTSWNKSIQARKQRKFRYAAPLHVRQKFVHVHLSKDLRAKHGVRSTQIRKGDKVRVLRGQFKKREAQVERVSLHFSKVYLSGLDVVKRDGSKVQVALEPSNLVIVELDLKDKRRKEKLEAAKTKTVIPQSQSKPVKTVVKKATTVKK